MQPSFKASPLLDLDDPEVLGRLADEWKVSTTQVLAAAALVGRMPKALHFYFNSRSRPSTRELTATDYARFERIRLGRRVKRGPGGTFDGP